MNLDFRTMTPKPFLELFPALMPLDFLDHQALIGPENKPVLIYPPSRTANYPLLRPSSETANPVDLSSFGPTVFAPLGSIVNARSGDKGDNSNIGFFVRNTDEYPWLQALLTVERLKELLGEDWTRGDKERRVERAEFEGILAVHL